MSDLQMFVLKLSTGSKKAKNGYRRHQQSVGLIEYIKQKDQQCKDIGSGLFKT